jgi:hypothetical protein
MTFPGYSVPPISTSADEVAHAPGKRGTDRLYCGRRRKDRAVTNLARVKCADCLAALRADGVIR